MDLNTKHTIYNIILESIKETILFQLFRRDGRKHKVGKIHPSMLKDVFKMLNGVLANKYYRASYKKPLKSLIRCDTDITLYLIIYKSIAVEEKILNEIKRQEVPEFMKFDYFKYYCTWQHCKIYSDAHNYKLALEPLGYAVHVYRQDFALRDPFNENCIHISY